jgi:hypothetical protein
VLSCDCQAVQGSCLSCWVQLMLFSHSLFTPVLCAPCPVPQVLVYRSIPYPEVWQQPGYQALWFVQRLCLLALQCRAVYATAMAFKVPEQSWLVPASGQALGTATRGLL